MNKFWVKWVRIVKFVVSIQSSIILFVIYYLLILPIGLYLRFFSKSSLKGRFKAEKEESHWVIRNKVSTNILWARSQ